MRIHLATLGCKLNQAEVEVLARRAQARGHQVVRDPGEAEWAIINTCAVTHIAARKSRRLIRHLHKLNPSLHLAVIGCYAEVSPEETGAIEGVSLVVPNANKEEVLERIFALSPEAEAETTESPSADSPQDLALGRTRALVKIQDGCDNECAYCLVTMARGPSRSRSPGEVLGEVMDRVAEGYREVILTGVSIGAYGRERDFDSLRLGSGCWSLARLVEAILDRTTLSRLRLSSIEPWDMTDELLTLWADPRFLGRLCRHFHLPLQSGCDATLERMGRGYTTEGFAQTVQAVRQRIPLASITTDIIVGFPGETEAEFKRSRAFIQAAGFSRLHVFRYSPRPGTRADVMPHQVGPRVAQKRSDELMTLGKALALSFHQRFLDSEVEVLFESLGEEHELPLWSGLTDSYLRVSAPYGDDLANTFGLVRCVSADERGLRGVVVRTAPQ